MTEHTQYARSLLSRFVIAPRLDPDSITTVARCTLALLTVVMFGAVGFLFVERDWDFWQSLYFTLITITTVGYGDEGLSPSGKVFASVILLAGIGTVSYNLSALVQVVVKHQFAWKKRMQQRIDRLRNHIVVCGFGRMGKTVCAQFAGQGVGFVVIERDEQQYQTARDLGYPAILGNASEDEVLGKAGVQRSRGVVCVLNSDAENIFITLCAKDLNERAFIACRAETEGAIDKVRRAGASLVVSPHFAAGRDIAAAILRPHLAEFMQHRHETEGGFHLDEVTIAAGSPVVGQSVAQFGKSEPFIVFVAIKRADGEMVFRPHGNVEFQAGDIVIVAGDPKDLSRMRQTAGADKESADRKEPLLV